MLGTQGELTAQDSADQARAVTDLRSLGSVTLKASVPLPADQGHGCHSSGHPPPQLWESEVGTKWTALGSTALASAL